MLYLFYSQGLILFFFTLYYLNQFLNNANYLKIYEGFSLLFLLCCLSPYIIIILCKIYDVNIKSNGIFAEYQKIFYINYDQDLNILVILNFLIILVNFIIFFFYFFIYKKINTSIKVTSYKNKIYFYVGLLLNFFCLIYYLYVSCIDNTLVRNGGVLYPYLISSYLQNNTFIFNSFFIFKLPLLSLIFSLKFTFENKKLNYILFITSLIIFFLINLRSASITPLLTIFFILALFFKGKYKIIGIICLFFITLGLHHLKSETNKIFVSTCLTSVQITSKNFELVSRSLLGENIFTSKTSIIKDNNNIELHKLTYALKFLTRIEFISLSSLVIRENYQNYTYKYLVYKFIPRYLWENKPFDDIAVKFNKDVKFKNDTNISIIKLDIFTEGLYNFKYLGFFIILLLYLFIGLIISYIYNKSNLKNLQVMILYGLSNFIWFDNHASMLLGDTIYDFFMSLLIISSILFYELKKNIFSFSNRI